MLKLKYSTLALAILMAAGFVFSGNVVAECEPGEERETMTGAVFTCDDSYPDLGEAWRDERGLIWGDTVKKSDGTVHLMNYNDAAAYCVSIGARLPTRAEFTSLREDMGAQSGTFEGYSAQVLPNLYYYWFWFLTVGPGNPDYAYFFDGKDGVFGHDYRDSLDAVRCVVSPGFSEIQKLKLPGAVK